MTLLNDAGKFKSLSTDTYKSLIKYEDRNNRLCDMLLKERAISQQKRMELRAIGSRPGIMFGHTKAGT